MKKIIYFFLLFSVITFSQTLLQSIRLPATTYFNSGYGLTAKDGLIWISSGSSTTGKGLIYGLDNQGQIVDSLRINYPTIRESQGLAWDGTHFWYLEQTASRINLRKVTTAGEVVDSIFVQGIYSGGVGWDGSHLWVSVYYPNPSAALWRVDVNTKTVVDTIPVFGTQPTGVTVKGDTLFYVMDGFEGHDERIYALKIATGDTLFSFHVPEVPGSRQNPRGLAWDGTNFWLLAEPLNASTGRSLYKYDLGGPGSPLIQLLTQTLNYGNVTIGLSSAFRISVKNNGNANLVIDSVRISDAAFTFPTALPLTVAPGETKQYPVSFAPTQYRAYTDSIMLFHNDVNFAYSRVKLNGAGIYGLPTLVLSSEDLNYGNKRINSLSSMPLQMINAGGGDLVIDSIKTGTETYKTSKIGFPVVIDSVMTFDFKVWAQPDQYKSFIDTLKIYSNSASGAVKSVPLSLMVAPFDSTLGSVVWQGIIPDNPDVVSQDLSARFIKRIKDLNGDGEDDLIVSTDNYQTIAYNGNSSGNSDIIWRFSTAPDNSNTGPVNRLECIQVDFDLTGDGINDVVIGTGGGNETVYLINGETGAKVWEFGDPINPYQGDINGLDATRDWTGDGVVDVLVSQSGNEFTGEGKFSVYLVNGATGQQVWRLDQSAEKKLKDACVAYPGGGAVSSRQSNVSTAEILGLNDNGQIIWTRPVNATVWGMTKKVEPGGGGATILAGDVNGWIYKMKSSDGSLGWSVRIGSAFIEDIFFIPDMNGDGEDDILVSALTPIQYVLSGTDGNVLMTGNTMGNILGASLLGDINADSVAEIGTASLDNNLYVFNAKNGQSLFTYPFGSGSNSLAAESIWKMDDVDNNGTYEFAGGSRDGRLIAFSGGTQVPVLVDDLQPGVIKDFRLEQNYPNPFNPSTMIKFSVPEFAKISLRIYDILGREVKTLVNGDLKTPGAYSVEWNGTDNYGSKVSSGIYFYSLESGSIKVTRKMMMLK